MTSWSRASSTATIVTLKQNGPSLEAQDDMNMVDSDSLQRHCVDWAAGSEFLQGVPVFNAEAKGKMTQYQLFKWDWLSGKIFSNPNWARLKGLRF